MLAGVRAGKLLERILADPESFMENAELEDADWEPPRPGQSTALDRDLRLSRVVASLKAWLARAVQKLRSEASRGLDDRAFPRFGYAKILEQILLDPDSLTIAEDRLIEELEGRLEVTSAALQPEEYARLQDRLIEMLSDDTRFSLAVACLKASLSQQRKAQGSN